MVATADNRAIFEELNSDEMDMVVSFAVSLVNGRREHTDAYNRFQEIRKKMTERNPMTMDEIDRIIHTETV